jgi:hypothetical protein
VTFHVLGPKANPMSFLTPESAEKTHLLLLLIAQYYETDPVARGGAVLSRFLDDAVREAGYDWRPSPTEVRRALRKWGALKRDLMRASGKGPRVPRASEGETLP